MKEITIKLYTLSELSQEARERAINDFRRRQSEYWDDTMLTEDLTERIKEAGFIDPKIQYSLSYSQGDGLSFSAYKYEHIEKLFNEVLGQGKEKTAHLLAENCTQIIKGNTGRYCFASRSDIDLYLENYTSSINVMNTHRIDEVIEKVREKFEDIYLDLCEKLEKSGYEQIEYENSDEYITETIEANEYTFEENGKMRNH